MPTIQTILPRAIPAAGGAALAARRLGRMAVAAGLTFLVAFAAACSSDDSPTEGFGDTGRPIVEATATTGGPDSIVAFTVKARDNLGVKLVGVTLSGGITAVAADTMRTAQTEVTKSYSFTVPSGVAPGTPVVVVASAMDGAGNVSLNDTLTLSVGNLEPPSIKVTSPAPGTVVVVGKSVVLALSGRSALKVRALGYEAAGAATGADSTMFSSPLRDSVATLDTLTIPADAGAGPLTVTPFIVDSLGQRLSGSATTLTVQTAASANTKPSVTFGITPRVEVTDTLHVDATDQAGISSLGYEVTDFSGTLIAADSVASSGNFTSVPATFMMRLAITDFPTKVLVSAFARNANGTREYALTSGGAQRKDTVVVVAGVTRPLPFGGRIADGYYHQRNNRLYLTNVDRNVLEVFSLADSAFKTPIVVGSRPWGIAPWPRNRNGDVGDTLLVANSGGTNISYVNLNGGGSGLEVYRYPLPNIIVYSVTSVKSGTTGEVMQQRTIHDFSDRPQFVGATCAGDSSLTTPCGEVIVVYSTTPTPGQSQPFDKLNGTVRWENVTTKKSHFFFEQAVGQSAGRADTLEIERFPAQGVGLHEIMVPYRQLAIGATDTLIYSVIVRLNELAFRDTTYVRNSASFRRAIIGEGGQVLGSRAVMYDAVPGLATGIEWGGEVYTLQKPVYDLGVSASLDVSDYVANSFATVKSVGINFDGSLAAVRADSTYLIDPTLRLQGLLQTSGGNAGFDFHPQNTGLNSLPLVTRLSFAAASEPQIEIFDTHCYQRVSTVPVRDPIIGPIKAAVRPTGEIMLVGATSRGAVIVSLPNNFTTSCP